MAAEEGETVHHKNENNSFGQGTIFFADELLTDFNSKLRVYIGQYFCSLIAFHQKENGQSIFKLQFINDCSNIFGFHAGIDLDDALGSQSLLRWAL